ncbi:Carbonic anhydrase [Aphelenchoides besseyi]|nr:Carbonic anhydrase [Aphelenchoides besseyi]
MPGLKNLLNGVLKFRATVRKDLVKQFERVRNNPQPAAIFFTCMDSRILPARFTQAQVGDMFVVRNSGNMIPLAETYGVSGYEISITTEPAALEMAVKRGKIEHVIVCGHSDCKAINTLYNLHCCPSDFDPQSPMDHWLRKHGFRSVSKLVGMQEAEKKGDELAARRLEFVSENPLLLHFFATIDPDNKFGAEDRLSQINTLQQLSHIASHGFLQEYLAEQRVHLHALWFDVYKGDMHMFSRERERFILIDETTVGELEREVRSGYEKSKMALTA